MTTMNPRLVPILMIAVILTGSIRPFSQNVINPPPSASNENSEEFTLAESVETGPGQEETEKNSDESSKEDSDSSRPSTQGESLE